MSNFGLLFLKKILLVYIFSLGFLYFFAQPCPSVYDFTINNSQNTLLLCSSDSIFFNSKLSNSFFSDSIGIFWSTQPTFDPYAGQGNKLVSSKIVQDKFITPCSICPFIEYIFINACNSSGREPDNEFMIINSGSGFSAQHLQIKFNLNPGNLSTNNDINLGSNPCGLQTPSANLINSIQSQLACQSAQIIPVGPTDIVPPQALVIFFTSSNVSADYDFSSWCLSGQPIYVMQSICNRNDGAFGNSNVPNRIDSTVLSFSNCGCTDIFRYSREGLQNIDGEYAKRHSSGVSRIRNGSILVNSQNPCEGPLATIVVPPIVSSPIGFRINDFQRKNSNFAACGFDTIYLKAILIPHQNTITCPNSSPSATSNTVKMVLTCSDISISGPNRICPPGPETLSIIPKYNLPKGNFSFRWNTGASSASISIQNKITVWAEATKNSCKYRDTHIVENYDSPIIDVFPTLDSCISVNYKGTVFIKDTFFTDTVKTARGGCDSLYKTQYIKILNSDTSFHFACMKPGEPYLFMGNTFWNSGLYEVKIRQTNKCDSVYIIKIDTISLRQGNNSKAVGCGEYFYKEILYKTDTTISDTLKSFANCDSVYRKLKIQILKPAEKSIARFWACDSIFYQGNKYFKDTTIVEKIGYSELKTCDSIYKEVYLDMRRPAQNFILLDSVLPVVSGKPLGFSARNSSDSLEWFYKDLKLNDKIIWTDSSRWLYVRTIDTFSGCNRFDSVWIEVVFPPAVFDLPGSFSPNADYINDYYQPEPQKDIEWLNMEIYNRWGTKVFDARGKDFKWDGKFKGEAQQSGTYVVVFEYIQNSTIYKIVKTIVLMR